MWQNNLVEILLYKFRFSFKKVFVYYFPFFQCNALFIVRTLNKKVIYRTYIT